MLDILFVKQLYGLLFRKQLQILFEEQATSLLTRVLNLCVQYPGGFCDQEEKGQSAWLSSSIYSVFYVP